MDYNEELVNASKEQDFEKIKKLLINGLADIHYKNDWILQEACYNGNLDLVKFLLTSEDLKEKANIHAEGDSPLLHACKERKYDVLVFLLASEDLKEKADIHAQEDYVFELAVKNDDSDIVRFLLSSSLLKDKINLAKHVDLIATVCQEKQLYFNKCYFDQSYLDTKTEDELENMRPKHNVANYLIKEFGLEQFYIEENELAIDYLSSIVQGGKHILKTRIKKLQLEDNFTKAKKNKSVKM